MLPFTLLLCYRCSHWRVFMHSNDMTSWQNSSARRSRAKSRHSLRWYNIIILCQTPCIRQDTFFKFKGKRTKCLVTINYATTSLQQNVILHKMMISCNILFYFLTILVMHLVLCTLFMSQFVYREIWFCPYPMHYIKIARSNFCQIRIINK